jgi:hypothetical protein
MSIASAIATKQQQVADAYTACNNKGATMPALANQNLSNLATTIGTISGGSPVVTHKVYWYDYDGTVLKEDDVPDGGTSTAPTVPSHAKLTFREWVHGNTITNVKQDYFNIARHACLENGFIRKVNITSETDHILTIWLRKGYYDSVNIDWGDGTTETYSAGGENFTVNHTYSSDFSGYVIATKVGNGTVGSVYNVGGYECGVEEYYFGVDSVMNERSYLGRWNPHLKAVVLPDTLTTLYYATFSNYCPKVLALPSTVTKIQSFWTDKLYDKNGVEALNIPSAVTTIENEAFFENWGLRFITKDIAATSLGNRVFAGCSSLQMDLVFTGNVSSVGNGGMFYSSGLRSISLANSSFTTLGNYGNGFFGYCSNLVEITLPESLSITTIANGAFYNCTALVTINNFPKNATTIGNEAFFGCHSLITPIVFENVTSMGNGVFSQCRSVSSISLDGTFTTLNAYQQGFFYECYKLSSLSFPNTITSIGSGCFRYCHSLKSLTIPASVTSIGDTAIANGMYGSLETVILSDSNSTMTIGHSNINALYNLKSIYIGSGVSISNSVWWFTNLQLLKEIDCANGWIPNQNLPNLEGSPFLKASSLVSFFTHLGDNTGGTARTISLGSTNLNKLTAAEKAIATDKNYVLA